LTKIRFKRGPASALNFTPQDGEPVWTNSTGSEANRLFVGDGSLTKGVTVGFHATPSPGNKSGYRYYPTTVATAFVTGTSTANVIGYAPIYIGGNQQSTQEVTLSTLDFEVTTAQAGVNAQIGIYTGNAQGEPNNLIDGSGNISLATTGIKSYSLTTTSYHAGWYWIALFHNASTAAFRLFDNLSTHPITGDSTSNFSLENVIFEVRAFASGLPSTATIGGSSSLDFPAVRITMA